MTYTDRVNILAEKMAEVSHNQLHKSGKFDSTWAEWSGWMRKHKYNRLVEIEIAHMLPLAEIALQDTAELTEQAYKEGYDDAETKCYKLTRYINSLGLIPIKSKHNGNNK
jgi:hypothetical protein